MKDKLQKLQVLEQNLQMLLSQKHALQSQLLSVESALTNMAGETVYQFVGNILLEKKTAGVKVELEKKAGLLKTKIESYETQEKSFSSMKQELEKELLGESNGGAERCG